MNDIKVTLRLDARRLSPTEGYGNSVIILIKTKSDDIFVDPTTGHRTLTASNPDSPPLVVEFNLSSLNRHHIHSFLNNKLIGYRLLCRYLASEISTAATRLGFGFNGFVTGIVVTVTYRTFLVMSSAPSDDDDKLKGLKIETEPCSICLESLSGSKSIVPMNCSHVFHDQCLLEWLHRKNTCPLCRTMIYDR